MDKCIYCDNLGDVQRPCRGCGRGVPDVEPVRLLIAALLCIVAFGLILGVVEGLR